MAKNDVQRIIDSKRARSGTTTVVIGGGGGSTPIDTSNFLLRDGSQAMAGTLNMGGNAITNVTLVDGTDISAHVADVNIHHTRRHNIFSTDDHLIEGNTAYDLLGFDGSNVFGYQKPSAAPGTATKVLMAVGGLLTLPNFTATTAVTTPLVTTASGDLVLAAAEDVTFNPATTLVRLATDNALTGTVTFGSGFAGAGFKLDNTASGVDLTLDSLTVRGRMNIYELLIHQIRMTNGSILVANAGKVKSVTHNGGVSYTMTTDDETVHPFAIGDIIRAQKFTGSGTTGKGVYQSDMTVTGITDTTFTANLEGNTTVPAIGMEFGRLGNTTDVDRQGSIYLTADDSGAPFIDILDGVTSHAEWGSYQKNKVRLGNLAGITDSIWGDLSGYGLYSSYAYLKGGIALVGDAPSMTGKAAGLYAFGDKMGYWNAADWAVSFDDSGNFVLQPDTYVTYNTGQLTEYTTGSRLQYLSDTTAFPGETYEQTHVGILGGEFYDTRDGSVFKRTWWANSNDGNLYAGPLGETILGKAGLSLIGFRENGPTTFDNTKSISFYDSHADVATNIEMAKARIWGGSDVYAAASGGPEDAKSMLAFEIGAGDTEGHISTLDTPHIKMMYMPDMAIANQEKYLDIGGFSAIFISAGAGNAGATSGTINLYPRVRVQGTLEIETALPANASAKTIGADADRFYDIYANTIHANQIIAPEFEGRNTVGLEMYKVGPYPTYGTIDSWTEVIDDIGWHGSNATYFTADEAAWYYVSFSIEMTSTDKRIFIRKNTGSEYFSSVTVGRYGTISGNVYLTAGQTLEPHIDTSGGENFNFARFTAIRTGTMGSTPSSGNWNAASAMNITSSYDGNTLLTISNDVSGHVMNVTIDGSLNVTGDISASNFALITSRVETLEAAPAYALQQYLLDYYYNKATVDSKIAAVAFNGTFAHHSLTDKDLYDDHPQYVSRTVARTITAQHTFSPSATAAPFILGTNAYGQTVGGLSADMIDGVHLADITLSASQILTSLKTVDGSGSGLDADLLDGQSSAYYALAATTATAGSGLAGGGALGSNFTISLALPGGLSATSVNSAALHTHAIDSTIARSAVTMTAGNGFTVGSGGDLSANRTFAIGQGTLIAVGTNTVGIATGATYQFIGTGAGTSAAWQNLSTLAGAGITHTNGVLAVGQGTMITVNANDVALTVGSAQYQVPVTGATPFTPAWGNLSDFAGAGLDFAAGVFLVGAGLGITVNASDVALTTPGTLTVATENASMGSHTHAITASSAGEADAHLVKTDASGFLSLVKLRTPTVDTASGTLTLQPATDLILSPDSNLVKLAASKVLQSHNYASQTTGMRITNDGQGDFRYLFADQMHVKAFIADLEQALAGGQIIVKSVSVLGAAFTVPAAGATATLTVRDLPSAANMAVFETGDIVRLRTFSRASGTLTVTDAWGVVTSYADQASGLQTWTFTRSSAPNAGAMAADTVIAADSIVLDYGVTGNGGYEVNAIDGAYGVNSPYAQAVTWTVHPATGQVIRTRNGNLTGLFSQANEYGLYAGDGVAATSKYIRISSYAAELHNIPFKLYNGANQTVNFDTAGTDVWIGPTSSDKRLTWNGTILAINGALVVGTTNKIWINEGADGVLAVGGSTKADAPFYVTATGALTAEGATLNDSALKMFSGATEIIRLDQATGLDLVYNLGAQSTISWKAAMADAGDVFSISSYLSGGYTYADLSLDNSGFSHASDYLWFYTNTTTGESRMQLRSASEDNYAYLNFIDGGVQLYAGKRTTASTKGFQISETAGLTMYSPFLFLYGPRVESGTRASLDLIRTDSSPSDFGELAFWETNSAEGKRAQVYSALSGTSGGKLVFATGAAYNSAPSPRMTIDYLGNVGIGTTGPAQKLVVSDTIAALDIISTSHGVTTRIFSGEPDGDGGLVGTQSNHNFFVMTNDTIRMAILAGGNVGIGTTNPGEILHISKGATGNSVIEFTRNAENNWIGVGGAGYLQTGIGAGDFGIQAKNALWFMTNGNNARMVIDKTSGNVGIGTTDPKSKLHVTGLPKYASQAAAGSAGLTEGALFILDTPDGWLCIKL